MTYVVSNFHKDLEPREIESLYSTAMRKHSRWAVALGHRVGQYSQCESFVLGIPTCWYLKKTLKFALPPTPTLKFALPPTQTPKSNRWNIGRFGSTTQNYRVGHVDFMLFVLISFTNPVCSGIWAEVLCLIPFRI